LHYASWAAVFPISKVVRLLFDSGDAVPVNLQASAARNARRDRLTSVRYDSGALAGHDDSRLLGLINLTANDTNMVRVAAMGGAWDGFSCAMPGGACCRRQMWSVFVGFSSMPSRMRRDNFYQAVGFEPSPLDAMTLVTTLADVEAALR
jgi:hypothetical protein